MYIFEIFHDFLIIRQDPVYTVPDPYGDDMKLKSFKSKALEFALRLEDLITTNHINCGRSKYDHKLTKLDVVS